MPDILNQIVAVKREEIAAAIKRKPLAEMRLDAESRVQTRDFVGALREVVPDDCAALFAVRHAEIHLHLEAAQHGFIGGETAAMI